MKVVLITEHTKDLPKVVVTALGKELFKRVLNQLEGCNLTECREGSVRIFISVVRRKQRRK